MASSQPPTEGPPPSFAAKRAKFASNITDARYAYVAGFDASKHRLVFNQLMNVINGLHEGMIGDAEPKNPHEAAACHTAMVMAFKEAINQSANYVLACLGEAGAAENIEADDAAARAFVLGLLSQSA